MSIEVIAHRGASAYAPEHTWAAYDLALALGADTLELDVRLTADRRLVVVHDPGPEELRRDELPEALELEEVLRRYRLDARFLVEMKDPRPWMPRRVLEAIDAQRVRGRTTVQSFDRAWLRRLRRQDPGIPVAALLAPWRTRRGLLRALPALAESFDAIHVWHRTVDAGLVDAAHARGLRVGGWTANAAADLARLAACGADGVITDAPDVARAALVREAVLAA